MLRWLFGDIIDYAPLAIRLWLRQSLATMMEIETESDDGKHLLTVRGDYVSLVRLNGMRFLPTVPEINEIAAIMESQLKAFFETPGRALQFFFLCDPDRTAQYIGGHLERVQGFGQQVDLDIETLLEERRALWTQKMCVEDTCIVVWTRRSSLTGQEKSAEWRSAMRRKDQMPFAKEGQKSWLSSTLLAGKHEGFLLQVCDVLNRIGVGTSVIPPHEALRIAREVFYPNTVGSNWRPRLLSDPPVPREVGIRDKVDVSSFLQPPLHRQLFHQDAQSFGFGQAALGPNRFASVDLALAPEVPYPFSVLYDALRRPPFPCRVSFLLESGGARGMEFRKLFATMFARVSTTNRRLVEALEAMKTRRSEGQIYGRFRCSAATWAPSNEMELVNHRSARLDAALQGWGAPQTRHVAGDPVEAVMSSALALHATSTAPSADAPLTEVFSMMPWSRAGSAWDSGALLYMTPEGRPYPIDVVGSKRNAVVRLFVGGVGTGKSMLMNTMNMALAFSPVVVTGAAGKLPYIRVLDVGYSAKGMVDLLREALPPDVSEHLVRHVRFQNTEEFAYNIFDTQLGCRYPLPHERESVINILMTKCTPVGGKPYEGMSGLITFAVDEAFKFRADDSMVSQPKRYQRNIEIEVDRAIDRLEINLLERPTWWDVVDALFHCGEFRLASIAQHHAVPILDDLVVAANVDFVADLYREPHADTGESLVDLFLRLVQEMIRELPVLASPTQFDLGVARVIVLDMQEMCRPGGPRTTALTQVMYLVASHILSRDFLLHEDQIERFPERYRAYNLERIREFMRTVKALCFDEMHVVAQCEQIVAQIDMLERTTRKNAFHISLASQELADFPPRVAALATEIYITGLDSGESADTAVERFGLCKGSSQIIRRRLTGPGRLPGEKDIYGAPFLAILRLDDGLRQIEQMLFNLIGPVEIWALTTRPDDVSLREQLVRLLGPREAWRRLASVFPAGTARDEVERRANHVAGRGRAKDDARQAVITDLVVEIYEALGIAVHLRPASELPEGVRLLKQHADKVRRWLDNAA